MLTAQQHIQREWLNARCHILEVAAILDRIDRAGDAAAADPTCRQIRDLLQIVQSPPANTPRTPAILAALSHPS